MAAIAEQQADPIVALAKVTRPDADGMQRASDRALKMVADFPIETDSDYEMAAEELAGVKGRIKKLEDQRTAITGPINAGLKAINDLFRKPRETLEKAEALWKEKMLSYTAAKEHIASVQQQQADASADAERARLTAEADKALGEAEEKARALVNEGKNADALKVLEAARAKAAELAGQAAIVTSAVAPSAETKVSGISTRDDVEITVENLHELIKFVATREDLKHLLVPDSIQLRRYFKLMGPQHKVPGVKVAPKKILAAKAK